MTQRDCDDCRYCELEGTEEPCKSCKATAEGFTNWKEREHPTMTNADRIRAMSDEEMAVFLYEWSPLEFCGHVCPRLRDDIPCKGECFEMRREWLQQPCDGGDNA